MGCLLPSAGRISRITAKRDFVPKTSYQRKPMNREGREERRGKAPEHKPTLTRVVSSNFFAVFALFVVQISVVLA
jgi:hypothetical protein